VCKINGLSFRMKPIEHFKFCPRCAQPGGERQQADAFKCQQCGFLYYFNPAIAAAGILLNSRGEALLIQRAKEPALGKLAFPGGFINASETAENALRREVQEELSLPLTELEYLCSHPNVYHYKEVTYSVLDFFFVGRAEQITGAAAHDEIQSVCWRAPARIAPEELAFESHRQALAWLLARNATQV
jgi:NAD+ diphosphatase